MPAASTTSAKDRALRLLGVRSRSREELRRRLAQAGCEPDEIAEALDDLESVGLVDDEAFARELATYQMARRGSGRRVAIGALRKAGLDRELAERVVDDMAPDDEETRAEDLARSRLSRLRGVDGATAYRRLLSFLQRRGYDGQTAREAARRVLSADMEAE